MGEPVDAIEDGNRQLEAARELEAIEDQYRELGLPLPPTVHSAMAWGKYGRGTARVTYLEAARRDPGYLQWAAKTLGGERGRLCAEALALHLGVTE